tara:strand:- start:71 stop:328 length:258 start_codon:yes stop_codon:yes gene_type:complete
MIELILLALVVFSAFIIYVNTRVWSLIRSWSVNAGKEDLINIHCGSINMFICTVYYFLWVPNPFSKENYFDRIKNYYIRNIILWK